MKALFNYLFLDFNPLQEVVPVAHVLGRAIKADTLLSIFYNINWNILKTT